MSKNLELLKYESDTLKGFFILFIIIGHNHILCPIDGLLMIYLYHFHVIAFFILPFLYSDMVGKLNWHAIREYAIRNYIPYVLFFTFAFLLYHIGVRKDGFDILLYFKGFISGAQPILKHTTGFYFLWFLPAFFSVTLVRIIYDNSNRWVKIVFISICLVLHVFVPGEVNSLNKLIPFAMVQGFYYFGFGLLSKYLLEYIPNIKYIGAVVFILLSVFYFIDIPVSIPFVFPVSFFLFAFSIVKWLVRIPGLKQLGIYSLPVYLIHVFIYNGLERMIPASYLWGVIALILTVLLSYLFSYLIMHWIQIRKLVFPKNWYELRYFYHIN